MTPEEKVGVFMRALDEYVDVRIQMATAADDLSAPHRRMAAVRATLCDAVCDLID
jgi:hypothetical protein